MKSAKCLESLISFKCSKCPLCCNVRIIIDLKQCKKRYYCASPSCVHSTESTQHLHCRVFRVMVMLLPLLFFTQSKGGKSIKRCVHGISCWGDDLSIVMKSGIPKSPKPDEGTKTIVRPNPEK